MAKAPPRPHTIEIEGRGRPPRLLASCPEHARPDAREGRHRGKKGSTLARRAGRLSSPRPRPRGLVGGPRLRRPPRARVFRSSILSFVQRVCCATVFVSPSTRHRTRHTDSVASHSQLSRCIAHRGSDRYSMRSTRPARRHRTSHVAGTGHSVTLHSRDVTEAQDGRSARYSILYLWRRSEGHMISHGTSTPRKHGLFTCERVPPSGNERTELLLLCV